MASPTAAVINFASALSDDEVRAAIHGVNRQITENFAPIWGYARDLIFFAPAFDPADPDTLAQEDVPADSVIYLVNEASVPGALGFHDLNLRDVPFGFVFVLDPKDWTTTLSHECLELILDPTATALIPGPDPRNAAKTVLHAYEACDAVERLSYSIGDIQVSDFVTPSYFTPDEAAGRNNDFLGAGVPSFGVTRGSHIAFFDLDSGNFETVFGEKAPARRNLAMRAEKHDHAKPERPTDDKLRAIVNNYRASKIAKRASGLPNVSGLTRTARYREAVGKLSRKAAGA